MSHHKGPNTGPPASIDYILDWLEKDNSDVKKTYSLYLSKPLYDEFCKYCHGKKPAKVIEYLMQHFVNVAKERVKK
jgi:hypothetical protein